MIIYNTIMGVAAGLALILVPMLAHKLYARKKIAPEGWAMSFGVLGVILAVLGGLMSTTWPLTANPPINIVFGEPCLLLGLLLVAASLFLWQRREIFADLSGDSKKDADAAFAYLQNVAKPVSWIIFAVGLILLSCALAIFRFELVGGAPVEEPITGRFNDYPQLENTFFALLYGLPAIGALLTPLAVRNLGGKAAKTVLWTFMISGVTFLLFSALNFYTHVGLLVNLLEGTNYKW